MMYLYTGGLNKTHDIESVILYRIFPRGIISSIQENDKCRVGKIARLIKESRMREVARRQGNRTRYEQTSIFFLRPSSRARWQGVR